MPFVVFHKTSLVKVGLATGQLCTEKLLELWPRLKSGHVVTGQKLAWCSSLTTCFCFSVSLANGGGSSGSNISFKKHSLEDLERGGR